MCGSRSRLRYSEVLAGRFGQRLSGLTVHGVGWKLVAPAPPAPPALPAPPDLPAGPARPLFHSPPRLSTPFFERPGLTDEILLPL